MPLIIFSINKDGSLLQKSGTDPNRVGSGFQVVDSGF